MMWRDNQLIYDIQKSASALYGIARPVLFKYTYVIHPIKYTREKKKLR